MTEKPSVTFPGHVEKTIEPPAPTLPEKAQISIEGAEELYRELRVENSFETENGEKVKLKQGAKVDVTVAADQKDTTRS